MDFARLRMNTDKKSWLNVVGDHPFAAMFGLIGSLALIVGAWLVAFSPNANRAMPSRTDITPEAIVSALSSVPDTEKKAHFAKHFKGKRVRFDGTFRTATPTTISDDFRDASALTYIFETPNALVYVLFDESIVDTLQHVELDAETPVAVEGVLSGIKLDYGTALYLNNSTLPQR